MNCTWYKEPSGGSEKNICGREKKTRRKERRAEDGSSVSRVDNQGHKDATSNPEGGPARGDGHTVLRAGIHIFSTSVLVLRDFLDYLGSFRFQC